MNVKNAALTIHLANIAMRLGRRSPDQEHFVGEGAAEAKGLLAREMRRPYSYEMVGR